MGSPLCSIEESPAMYFTSKAGAWCDDQQGTYVRCFWRDVTMSYDGPGHGDTRQSVTSARRATAAGYYIFV